jgi:alginate O-acetyltransferase complex protein AlgI
MLFCSTAFLLFFAIVFTIYWSMPWERARVWLLVGASLYFYASWNRWLALVILISTTFDYFLARGIEASRSPRLRRLLVVLSVTANLGLLCYFKYVNFFLASLEQALRSVGASTSFPVLSVLLPIGVSFYTFEAINYVVDVYRGHVRAERNLANFLLFILFFPHLVAGPIVRARDFLPQVRRAKRWSWPRLELGAQLFLLGLLKKWALGDRMALFADPIFANPGAYRMGATWLGMLAYALQVYGDFSGYTDMAIGSAHMLGFKLARNFDMPYLAVNMSDFWRRWHISLSSWLRDYLFFPLGGSRGGRWSTCRNLMIVMTLAGLWHGASWSLVLWGALHGVFLVVYRFFSEFCATRPTWRSVLDSGPGTIARIGFTFICHSLSLVIFRSPTLGMALQVFRGLVVPHRGLGDPMEAWGLLLTFALLFLCWILARRGFWRRITARLPAPVVGAAYGLLLSACMLLAPPTGQPFIYFQF